MYLDHALQILKENDFTKEEIEQLAEEHSNYNISANGETLLALYKNPLISPELKSEIDLLRSEMEKSFMSSLKSDGTLLPRPELFVVTGSPGAGKSSIIKEIQKRDIIYLCSDVFKKVLIKSANKLCDANNIKHLDCGRLENSGYTHGFSAEISWDMFYKFISERRSLCVETIGAIPLADTMMIRQAQRLGYKVTLIRVEVSQEESVIRAAKRYFKYDDSDKKRYISLPNILFMWDKIHAAFKVMMDLNKDIDLQVFNNEVPRNNPPKLVYHRKDNKVIHEESWGLNKYQRICSVTEDDDDLCRKKTYVAGDLWYLGGNHTGDMIVLRQNPIDGWEVLAVERNSKTENNKWSLPGGFVRTSAKINEQFVLDDDFESPQKAAIRELQEETGYILSEENLLNLHKLKRFEDRGRDPRDNDFGQVISNPFSVVLPYDETTLQSIVGMDDVGDAVWTPLSDIFGKSPKMILAFDHLDILKEALNVENVLGFQTCGTGLKLK